MIVQTDTIKIYNHHTISYLLISAPLFENNFLISIPIFLIEILFLFPEYNQTAGIYNQSLCCLDAYNKHLDANISALYKGLATSVRSNIINLQLSPGSKWFPVTRPKPYASVFK